VVNSSTRSAPRKRCASSSPAVLVLIFVILYLTYKDLADACLMMLAVPEALAGGALLPVFVAEAPGLGLER